VKCGIVDADSAKDLVSQLNVDQYPTLRLYSRGSEIPWPHPSQTREVGWIIHWARVRTAMAREAWKKMEKRSILEIDEDNIDSMLEEHPIMVIMFYAPTCEHCESMRPEYVQAARYMKGKVPFGRVNLAENRLGARFNMMVIPTVKLFVHRLPRYDYNNERDAMALARWVEDFEVGLHEDSVLELEADDFNEAVESNSLLLVQFYSSESAISKAIYPDWVRAAHKLRMSLPLARLDVVTEPNIAKDHKVDPGSVDNFPIVKLFRNGVAHEYKGDQHEKAIVKWCEEILKRHKQKAAEKNQEEGPKDWSDMFGVEEEPASPPQEDAEPDYAAAAPPAQQAPSEDAFPEYVAVNPSPNQAPQDVHKDCTRCTEDFAVKGGCEVWLSGDSFAHLVPDGCQACGEQVEQFCNEMQEELKEEQLKAHEDELKEEQLKAHADADADKDSPLSFEDKLDEVTRSADVLEDVDRPKYVEIKDEDLIKDLKILNLATTQGRSLEEMPEALMDDFNQKYLEETFAAMDDLFVEEMQKEDVARLSA